MVITAYIKINMISGWMNVISSCPIMAAPGYMCRV